MVLDHDKMANFKLWGYSQLFVGLCTHFFSAVLLDVLHDVSIICEVPPNTIFPSLVP